PTSRDPLPRHRTVAPRTGDLEYRIARSDQIPQRYGLVLPRADPRAVPRALPEERRAGHGHRASDRLRNRHQSLAAAHILALGMPTWMQPDANATLSAARVAIGVRRTIRLRRRRLRRVHVRSGQARAVPRATHSTDRLHRAPLMGSLAGRRPARVL